MCRTWHAVLSAAAIIFASDSSAIDNGLAKKDLTVSMLALGTSLTANYQWPRELEDALARCLGAKVNLENAARVGANSGQAVMQFTSRRLKNPDLVLIEFATNDADYFDGVDLATSRSNHASLFKLIRDSSPRSTLVLMTMGPAFGLRGWVRPSLADYYGMYRDLAASHDVMLIEFASVWERRLVESASRELFPDGLHPTQSVASQVILPILRDRIGSFYRPNQPNTCMRAP